MDEFDNLSFGVEVKDADNAVNHLDRIISKLKEIQGFTRKGGSTPSSTTKDLSAEEKFQKTREKWIETLRQKSVDSVKIQESLERSYAKQVEQLTILTKLLEKQAEIANVAKLPKEPNEPKQPKEPKPPKDDSGSTISELTEEEKALARLAKQRELATSVAIQQAQAETKLAQINAQNAVLTNLLAKGKEYSNAIEKKASLEYDNQHISVMARLRAEQQALNNGRFEEVERIRLANNAKKEEIRQRLKSELGLKQEEKQLDKNTKSLGRYLAKMTSVVMVARRLGGFFSKSIQESAAYVENLNLFAVAYGESYQQTINWALDIAEGFGLASNEVVKFAGTFRQLSTSLGLVEDTADSVSQVVTELGYDFSALFNTSVENAMQTLQSSVFSGQTKPLRRFGIDISQNQIDALFEANEALATLGVNARNLNQSDKVLARLIITLRDGSNAFGTMNREINTLQSQIRIMQGSLSNFKLAIGDLVNEPIRQALVYINGLIIGATKAIRAFKPLSKEDDNTLLTSIGTQAESAEEEIEQLQNKLAGFDKFNVLNTGNETESSSAVTEALTEELKKQMQLYEEQQEKMSGIANEAAVVGERIKNWFVLTSKDENGEEVFEGLTSQAKGLLSVLGLVAVAYTKISYTKGLDLAKKLTSEGKALTGLAQKATLLKKAFSPLGLTIIGVSTAFAYMYSSNEEFRESVNRLLTAVVSLVGDSLTPLFIILKSLANVISTLLKHFGGLLSSVLNIISSIIEFAERTGVLEALVWGLIGSFIMLKGIKLASVFVDFYKGAKATIAVMPALIAGIKEYALSLGPTLISKIKNFISWLKTSKAAAQGLATIGIGMLIVNIKQLVDNWGDLKSWQRVIGIFGAIGAAALAAAAAVAAFHGAWTVGTAAIAITGALLAIAGAFATFKKDTQIDGYADGGYTNANFIMTHENGKREWVGKAAGSSAIVNDTQMSDIMETAVAKGVAKALSARSEVGGGTTNETTVVQLDGKTLLQATRKAARKEGLDFSRVGSYNTAHYIITK